MRHRVLFGKPLPRGLLRRPATPLGGLALALSAVALAWLAAALSSRRSQDADEMIYFWPD